MPSITPELGEQKPRPPFVSCLLALFWVYSQVVANFFKENSSLDLSAYKGTGLLSFINAHYEGRPGREINKITHKKKSMRVYSLGAKCYCYVP